MWRLLIFFAKYIDFMMMKNTSRKGHAVKYDDAYNSHTLNLSIRFSNYREKSQRSLPFTQHKTYNIIRLYLM